MSLTIGVVSLEEVATLIVCLMCSALFSGSENALVSLSEAKTKTLIDEGRNTLKLWYEQRLRVLTAILVANNIVNIMASAMAGAIAQRISPGSPQMLGVTVGILTLIVLVFGEITPKAFAQAHASVLAPRLMYILIPVYYILYPVTRVLEGTTRKIINLGGWDLNTVESVTEAELEHLIAQSQQSGDLDAHAGQLINQVLDLDEKAAREAMSPRTELVTVGLETTREEILALYAQEGHSRMPVVGKNIDDIVGVVFVRDIIRKPEGSKAEELMREPVFVSELQRVDALLREFQLSRLRFAVVLDEYGGTAGCIGMEDILEMIVGEIRDEDEEESVIVVSPDHWVVDAKTKMNDLGDKLGHDFPDSEEYDSLAGLLITQLDRIPEVGDIVRVDSFEFIVEQTDEKRAVRVAIRRMEELEMTGESTAVEAISGS